MEVETLLLGPGGSNGFYELGALLYLEKNNYIKNVKKYIGVSIGSIICLLLIIGYAVEDIIAIATDYNLVGKIENFSLASIRSGVGIVSINSFKETLKEYVKQKLGIVPNLDQLYKTTGLEFSCVTFNVDTFETEYISYKNNPEISCVDAVSLSSSIPFIFQRNIYNGNTYIDGAYGDPFPIEYIDDGKSKICIILINNKFDNQNFEAIGYIFRIIYSPIMQLKKKSKKYMETNINKERLIFIEIESDNFDPVGIFQGIDKKAFMVLNGYEKAKSIISETS